MQKTDFKPRQTVCLRILPGSDAWRRLGLNKKPDSEQLLAARVESVGHRYITVSIPDKPWIDARFDITNGFRQTQGNDYSLYPTKIQAQKDIMNEILYRRIRTKYFTEFKPSLPLKTMLKIRDAIENPETDRKSLSIVYHDDPDKPFWTIERPHPDSDEPLILAVTFSDSPEELADAVKNAIQP